MSKLNDPRWKRLEDVLIDLVDNGVGDSEIIEFVLDSRGLLTKEGVKPLLERLKEVA